MRKSVYHGLQRVGSRRPFGNAAIRGARRIAENSNFEIPSASERAISAVTRDLSESSLQNRGRKSKERSLQQIPGVGPRNEQLFISAGVASVPTLLDIFFESMDGDKDLMRAFIQDKVGIRNGDHRSSILSYLANKDPNGTEHHEQANQRVTLCVEGNISAGKSTVLQALLKGSKELQHVIEVVPEPVDQWQHIQSRNGGEPFNLLEAFYKDPSRFAYTFQNYVFVTRFMQAQKSEGCTAPLRLLERSVFSDRMVFVRAVHEAKWLSEMELGIYDSWFDPVVSSLKGLIPDGFIYLAASPETCMRRMILRGRGEEVGVSLDYLGSLHTKHEEWLHNGTLRREDIELLWNDSRKRNNAYPISLLDKVGHALCPPPEEPESLRGKIFYINPSKQPLLQKHLDGLPALYLDCDKDTDMQRDQAAKVALTKQIKDFSDHVRKVREARVMTEFDT